jgi:signal transduction histidine kinase
VVRGIALANFLKTITLHRHSTTSRLLILYGVFFVVWGTVLLGLIYWETAQYLEARADRQLHEQVDYLHTLGRPHLLQSLADYTELGKSNYNAWGLFDAHGTWIQGGITVIPASLRIDATPSQLSASLIDQGPTPPPTPTYLVVGERLSNGDILVLAHASHLAARVSGIIVRALLWGLSFTLVPGLIGGLILSRGPRQRIREIEMAMQPIMRGDLGKRLPVGNRNDELDLLAAIVNRMLNEIERLMSEVKGVCDSIAHDLRTPLTRLRSQLHRIQQQIPDDDAELTLVGDCVVEVDELLGRFRALLRISELEDRHRREGFISVHLGKILNGVHELYMPLAEDRALRFELQLHDDVVVLADPDLLFEAFSNLVANAIKFTPEDGHVVISLTRGEPGYASVRISDTGPGISPSQRQAIWQRFYRGKGSQDIPGHGLGLSIVAAIAKLHEFEIRIEDSHSGACISMRCPVWRPS